GTRNPASGGEVWRSIDGVEWEKTVDDGFGEAVNEASYPQLVFRDQLYVVTFNLNGLNIFRSSDGEVWEKVVENGFGYGKYRNIYGVLREIGGTLYLSTFSTPKIGAFQIWKSNDGKDWTQVGQTGFGNENNHGAGISICSDGLMYVSTLNFLDGLEVWRSKDCLKWEMIFKEEHGSETHVGGGLIEFNNYLYMHIYDRDGLQIWKYMIQLRTVTPAQTLTTSAYSTLTQTSTATKLFWGIKEYAIIIVAAAVGALALLLVSKSAIFAKSKKRAAYCIHCGALIDESDEFCRKCGKQQQ
ncbi:MAG: hypothetical protein QXF26_05825, partial [Candidatus Bathyarchaeia archaeon]